jgi:hypothetical protein
LGFGFTSQFDESANEEFAKLVQDSGPGSKLWQNLVSNSRYKKRVGGGGIEFHGILGGNYDHKVNYVRGTSEVENYTKSASFEAKEQLLENLYNGVCEVLGVNIREHSYDSKDPVKSIRFMLSQLPNPETKTSFADKGEAIKRLADLLNHKLGTNININDDIKGVLSDIHNSLGSLAHGLHIEFATVIGDVRHLLKNLENLSLAEEGLREQIKELARTQPSNKKDEQEGIAKMMDDIATRRRTSIIGLENIMNSMGPDVLGLTNFMKNHDTFGEFIKRLDGTTYTVGSDNAPENAYKLLGSTLATAIRIHYALKKLAVSVGEFRKAAEKGDAFIKEFSQKCDQLALQNGNDADEIAQWKSLVTINIKDSEKLADLIERYCPKSGSGEYKSSSGGYSGGGYEVGSATGGDEFTPMKRMKYKRDRNRVAIMKLFNSKAGLIFDKILGALNFGKDIGTTVPVTEEFEEFTSNLSDVADFRNPQMYLSLIGLTNTTQSRELASEYMRSIDNLEANINKLASMQAYQPIHHKINAVKSLIADYKEFISSFKKVLTETNKLDINKLPAQGTEDSFAVYGEGEKKRKHKRGKGEDEDEPIGSRQEVTERQDEEGGSCEMCDISAIMTNGSGEQFNETYQFVKGAGYEGVCGGSMFDDIEKHMPKNNKYIQNIFEKVRIFKYYIKLASIRANMKAIKGELSKDDEGYNERISKIVGDKVSKLVTEYKSEVSALNTRAAAAGSELANKDLLKQVDTNLKNEYDVKKNFYEAIQSIDRVLKNTLETIVDDPQALSDIKRILDDTDIIANWYDDSIGNKLMELMFKCQGQNFDLDSSSHPYAALNKTIKPIIDNNPDSLYEIDIDAGGLVQESGLGNTENVLKKINMCSRHQLYDVDLAGIAWVRPDVQVPNVGADNSNESFTGNIQNIINVSYSKLVGLANSAAGLVSVSDKAEARQVLDNLVDMKILDPPANYPLSNDPSLLRLDAYNMTNNIYRFATRYNPSVLMRSPDHLVSPYSTLKGFYIHSAEKADFTHARYGYYDKAGAIQYRDHGLAAGASFANLAAGTNLSTADPTLLCGNGSASILTESLGSGAFVFADIYSLIARAKTNTPSDIHVFNSFFVTALLYYTLRLSTFYIGIDYFIGLGFYRKPAATGVGGTVCNKAAADFGMLPPINAASVSLIKSRHVNSIFIANGTRVQGMPTDLYLIVNTLSKMFTHFDNVDAHVADVNALAEYVAHIDSAGNHLSDSYMNAGCANGCIEPPSLGVMTVAGVMLAHILNKGTTNAADILAELTIDKIETVCTDKGFGNVQTLNYIPSCNMQVIFGGGNLSFNAPLAGLFANIIPDINNVLLANTNIDFDDMLAKTCGLIYKNCINVHPNIGAAPCHMRAADIGLFTDYGDFCVLPYVIRNKFKWLSSKGRLFRNINPYIMNWAACCALTDKVSVLGGDLRSVGAVERGGLPDKRGVPREQALYGEPLTHASASVVETLNKLADINASFCRVTDTYVSNIKQNSDGLIDYNIDAIFYGCRIWATASHTIGNLSIAPVPGANGRKHLMCTPQLSFSERFIFPIANYTMIKDFIKNDIFARQAVLKNILEVFNKVGGYKVTTGVMPIRTLYSRLMDYIIMSSISRYTVPGSGTYQMKLSKTFRTLGGNLSDLSTSDNYAAEDHMFVQCMKSIICKVFTILGTQSLFNNPEMTTKASPIRLILGGKESSAVVTSFRGGSGTPTIIDDAAELYSKLVLYSEFYKDIFAFDEIAFNPGTADYYISMVPDVTGLFSNFITLMFKTYRTVKNGAYTRDMVINIIDNVNDIYNKIPSESPDKVRAVVSEFVNEINRRYTILKTSDIVDFVRDENDLYRLSNDTDSKINVGDYNQELLPEENFEYDTYIAPSRKYLTTTDLIDSNRFQINKLEKITIGTSLNDRLTAFDRFKEKLAKYFNDNSGSDNNDIYNRDDTTVDDHANFLRHIKKDVRAARTPEEKLEIVSKTIIGEAFNASYNQIKYVFFHETVVTNLESLKFMYSILNGFRESVTKMHTESRLNDFIDLIRGKSKIKLTPQQTTMLGYSKANMVEAALSVDVVDAAKYSTLDHNVMNVYGIGYVKPITTFTYAGSVMASNIAISDDNVPKFAAAGIPDPRMNELTSSPFKSFTKYVDNRNPVAPFNGVTLTDSQLDEIKQCLLYEMFDYKAIMINLLEYIEMLTSSMPDLVVAKVTKNIQIDFSNLIDKIKTLMSDTAYYISIFNKAFTDKEKIKPFIDRKIPGSFYWLETHLIDDLINGVTYVSDNSPDSIRSANLTTVSSMVTNIFKLCTACDQMKKRTVVDVVGHTVTIVDVPKQDRFIRYGHELCKMVYYSLSGRNPIGGSMFINDVLYKGLNVSLLPISVSTPPRLDFLYNFGTHDMHKGDIHMSCTHSGAPEYNNGVPTLIAAEPFSCAENKDAYKINNSLVCQFNQILAQILTICADSSTNKVYKNVLNNFITNDFNGAIFGPKKIADGLFDIRSYIINELIKVTSTRGDLSQFRSMCLSIGVNGFHIPSTEMISIYNTLYSSFINGLKTVLKGAYSDPGLRFFKPNNTITMDEQEAGQRDIYSSLWELAHAEFDTIIYNRNRGIMGAANNNAARLAINDRDHVEPDGLTFDQLKLVLAAAIDPLPGGRQLFRDAYNHDNMGRLLGGVMYNPFAFTLENGGRDNLGPASSAPGYLHTTSALYLRCIQLQVDLIMTINDCFASRRMTMTEIWKFINTELTSAFDNSAHSIYTGCDGVTRHETVYKLITLYRRFLAKILGHDGELGRNGAPPGDFVPLNDNINKSEFIRLIKSLARLVQSRDYIVQYAKYSRKEVLPFLMGNEEAGANTHAFIRTAAANPVQTNITDSFCIMEGVPTFTDDVINNVCTKINNININTPIADILVNLHANSVVGQLYGQVNVILTLGGFISLYDNPLHGWYIAVCESVGNKMIANDIRNQNIQFQDIVDLLNMVKLFNHGVGVPPEHTFFPPFVHERLSMCAVDTTVAANSLFPRNNSDGYGPKFSIINTYPFSAANILIHGASTYFTYNNVDPNGALPPVVIANMAANMQARGEARKDPAVAHDTYFYQTFNMAQLNRCLNSIQALMANAATPKRFKDFISRNFLKSNFCQAIHLHYVINRTRTVLNNGGGAPPAGRAAVAAAAGNPANIVAAVRLAAGGAAAPPFVQDSLNDDNRFMDYAAAEDVLNTAGNGMLGMRAICRVPTFGLQIDDVSFGAFYNCFDAGGQTMREMLLYYNPNLSSNNGVQLHADMHCIPITYREEQRRLINFLPFMVALSRNRLSGISDPMPEPIKLSNTITFPLETGAAFWKNAMTFSDTNILYTVLMNIDGRLNNQVPNFNLFSRLMNDASGWGINMMQIMQLIYRKDAINPVEISRLTDEQRQVTISFIKNQLSDSLVNQVYDFDSSPINELADLTFGQRVTKEIYEDIKQKIKKNAKSGIGMSVRPSQTIQYYLQLPTNGEIIFSSLANSLAYIWSEKESVERTVRFKYLTDLISDMSMLTQHNMSILLPFMEKRLSILLRRTEFVKNIINTDINLELDTVPDTLGLTTVTGVFPTNEPFEATLGVDLRQYLIKGCDELSRGCVSLIQSINSVLGELSAKPEFFEVRPNAISNYQNLNNKLPFMPLSQMTYALTPNFMINAAPKGVTRLRNYSGIMNLTVPSTLSEDPYYQYNCGMRYIMTKYSAGVVLDKMPGVKDLFSKFSLLNSGVIDEAKYKDTLTNTLSILRACIDVNLYGMSSYLNDFIDIQRSFMVCNGVRMVNGPDEVNAVSTYQSKTITPKLIDYFKLVSEKLSFLTGGATYAVQQSVNAQYYEQNGLVMLRAQDQPTSIDDVLQLTTDSNQVKQYGKVASVIEYKKQGRDERNALIVKTILEMNIMPINPNMIYRSLPFAFIFNFADAFDRMVCNILNIPYKNTLTLLNNDISVPEELYAKLVISPFEKLSNDDYFTTYNLLMKGQGRYMSGKIKLLGDQLYNKTLFNTLYDTNVSTGNIAPHAFGMMDARYKRGVSYLDELTSQINFYNTSTRKYESLGVIRGVHPTLMVQGKSAFDTKVVRFTQFLVLLQHIMLTYLSKQIEQHDGIIIKSYSLLDPTLINYTNNFRDRTAPYAQTYTPYQ